MQHSGTVLGLFPDARHAWKAIEALKNAGFEDDELGGLLRDPEDAASGEAEAAMRPTMLTVRAGSRYEEVVSLLRSFGAEEVRDRFAGVASEAQMKFFTLPALRKGRDDVYEVRADPSRKAPKTSTLAPVSPVAEEVHWEREVPGYHNRWRSDYATHGGSWEVYEPYYRYAWEMNHRPEYRGRPWEEVDDAFQDDWASPQDNEPWDRVSMLLRIAWDSVTEPGFRESERGIQDSAQPADVRDGVLVGEIEETATARSDHEHRWVNDRCEVCGLSRREAA